MKKSIFLILSFTWGLSLTICGCLAGIFLLATGHRPQKWGMGWFFAVGRSKWGGLNLGPIFLCQRNASDNLKCHEHGHGIQNCFMGPLILPLVLLSAARYHDRERRAMRGEVLKPYDAWWFEGQATSLGTRQYLRKEE